MRVEGEGVSGGGSVVNLGDVIFANVAVAAADVTVSDVESGDLAIVDWTNVEISSDEALVEMICSLDVVAPQEGPAW